MIEPHLLEQLKQELARHGEVRSLSTLPPRAGYPACIVLATMHTPDAALAAQHAHGFHIFGFESLIIPENWIRQHLSQD